MPRDIPNGKKMPSLTVIGIGGKGPAGAGPGKADPAPDASAPADDSNPESTFTCPDCGAQLSVESKKDDAGEGAGMGADTLGG